MPAPASARTRTIAHTCAAITLSGVAAVSAILLAVQFLRTDLDWVTVPMSIYVLGAWGPWVQAGFLVAVPALASLGVGLWTTLPRHVANSVALALFVGAALALVCVATFPTDTTRSPVTLHGTIHQWAAFATFEFVTIGMTLQAWMFRGQARWRRHFPEAFALAVITTIYFWIYALFHPIPRGVGEKVLIVLVLLWVWRAAWWIVRSSLDAGSY